ncbi:MAG: hypothetical protein ACE5HF_10715, partial [Gemmatimonadota bacterium]
VADLAYVEGEGPALYVLDGAASRLLRLALPMDWDRVLAAGGDLAPIARRDIPIGRGGRLLREVKGHLVLALHLDHELLIAPLGRDGPELGRARRIRHDGPIWGFAARADDAGLWIATGGVEDRPLDRTTGEFGYVDSFLTLYRLPWDAAGAAGEPIRLAVENLSALGIVTPKALHFEEADGPAPGDGPLLRVSGYGGERFGTWRLDGDRLRLVSTRDVPAGIADFVVRPAGVIAADPLLDRVLRFGGPGAGDAPVRASPELAEAPLRTPADRLGEILFFTTLMAPANRSAGDLSRFTCETCHFEGVIDGRTHFTGRGHVHATTKTLRGLGDNVPLFSRGGDRTLSSMVVSEFRVANQARRDSLPLEPEDHPWLADLAGLPGTIGPEAQRLGLLTFLIDFRHRPQPVRASGRPFGPAARRGLDVFARRCAACHRPLTSTRDGGRVVPKAEWEAWLTDPDRDLVWGAPIFSKTGIEPYVGRAGARVPSLRRVASKAPYFTNGSSPDLRSVLERFRYRGLEAWHGEPAAAPARPGEASPTGDAPVRALTKQEIEDLLALLRWF